MSNRLQRCLLVPMRYPLRSLLVGALLGATGYLLWQMTPGVRFRREYAEAERALAAYDFADARRRLAECLRLRPDDPNAHLLAAQAARRDGDLEAAADHLLKYHELVGDTTEPERIEWALLQVQRGKVEEVVYFLIEFLEVRHPASERIFEALAMGSVHGYNFDRTRFWVEETLKKFPKNPVARLIYGQTMSTLGRRARALELLRELVGEYPRYTRAKQSLADMLVVARGYEEAARLFEELRRQDPESIAPLLGLVRCRDRQGRTEDAQTLLRELQKRHGDNSEVLLECGRFALRDGRFLEAESWLRRTVELAPHDYEAHLQLGICLQQLDKPEEANRHVELAKQIETDLLSLEQAVQAVVKAPSDPDPRLEAGRICLRNGQVAEGLRWLHGVLETHPNHKPAHRALAEYYAAQGDQRQAEHHRQRAR